MKTCFAVMRWEYSDRQLVAVFTEQVDAERFSAEMQKDESNRPVSIDVVALDPAVEELGEVDRLALE